MNDIMHENPYLKHRSVALDDYSLSAFLGKDIAVERDADDEQLIFAIGCLLGAHGFNINLVGYRYLLMLVARYVTESDYSESAAMTDIADAYGTSADYVKDSITACIRHNGSLKNKASKTLGIKPNDVAANDIASVVEILGALFKIYYNYNLKNERLTSGKRAVSLGRIEFGHG